MNIHEYQAKELFQRYGIPAPLGIAIFNPQEATLAAKQIIEQTGSETVVVKAQVHAGGRGKAGGVKVARGVAAAQEAADALFGAKLVSPQTGPAGKVVRRLLIEQGLAIAKELYLAVLLDREVRRITVVACAEGGVAIEEVAAKTPDKICKVMIDPIWGLMPFQARQLAFKLGLEKEAFKDFLKLAQMLVRLYAEEDASLTEINPLVITKGNRLVALDARVILDDNAYFRHDYRAEWDDPAEAIEAEVEAKKSDLSYIQLDGNIGCIVNGAGLAMATMDIIKHFGGEPANFLDVGGGAGPEAVTAGFKIILKSPAVKCVLVNIFGGIMKCDVVAEAMISACREIKPKVPLVVRLEGTNAERAREILEASTLSLIAATSMSDAAQKAVAAAEQSA